MWVHQRGYVQCILLGSARRAHSGRGPSTSVFRRGDHDRTVSGCVVRVLRPARSGPTVLLAKQTVTEGGLIKERHL